MKQKITHNLGLKILAIITSFILWLIIINVDDPVKMEEFNNVEVTLLNTEVVTENDKIYEILDKTNYVTVKVYARRSVLDTLDISNIRAYADLKDLEDTVKVADTDGSAYLDNIKISVSTNKYNSELESISASSDYIKVSIEDLKRVQKSINVEIKGEPAEGYVIGDVSTTSNLVKISGPASLINRIATAKVVADVTGFSDTISWDADIRLYDTDGNEVSSSKLNLSLDKVSTTIEILETKEVPITVNISGEPGDGFALNGDVEVTPETIIIAGESSTIANISKITVPASAVDVTDLEESYTLNVNLSSYLPSGIRIVDENYTGKVQVSIGIEELENQSIWRSVSDITLQNLPSGYSYKIVDPATTLMFTASGLKADLTSMNRNEIRITADMSDFISNDEINEGTYTVPVDIHVPTGIKVVGDYSVQVEITKD